MVIFNSYVKLPEGNYTDYTVYGTREYIYIYIWVNFITTSRRDRALESWLVREIIPKWA